MMLKRSDKWEGMMLKRSERKIIYFVRIIQKIPFL